MATENTENTEGEIDWIEVSVTRSQRLAPEYRRRRQSLYLLRALGVLCVLGGKNGPSAGTHTGAGVQHGDAPPCSGFGGGGSLRFSSPTGSGGSPGIGMPAR